MGFTIQTQRRAVEALLPHASNTWPKDVFANKPLKFIVHKFSDPSFGSSRSYEFVDFLGISEGFGTCSDVHGVNVAVFGFRRDNRHWTDVARSNVTDLSFLGSCTCGVILWPSELRVINFSSEGRIDYRCTGDPLDQNLAFIELLEFSKIEQAGYAWPDLGAAPWLVFLRRTGILSSHIPIL